MTRDLPQTDVNEARATRILAAMPRSTNQTSPRRADFIQIARDDQDQQRDDPPPQPSRRPVGDRAEPNPHGARVRRPVPTDPRPEGPRIRPAVSCRPESWNQRRIWRSSRQEIGCFAPALQPWPGPRSRSKDPPVRVENSLRSLARTCAAVGRDRTDRAEPVYFALAAFSYASRSRRSFFRAEMIRRFTLPLAWPDRCTPR